jgi:hypothetical protein
MQINFLKSSKLKNHFKINILLYNGDDSIKNLLELKENELKGFRNKFEKIESLWKKNQMKELELFFNDLFKQDSNQK